VSSENALTYMILVEGVEDGTRKASSAVANLPLVTDYTWPTFDKWNGAGESDPPTR
jgi:hypothetical protein